MSKRNWVGIGLAMIMLANSVVVSQDGGKDVSSGKLKVNAQTGSYYDTVEDGSVVDGYYIQKVENWQQLVNLSSNTEKMERKEHPVKYVLKPGRYSGTSTLNLWGNSYLYAEDVYVLQPKGDKRNLIRLGEKNVDYDEGDTGYAYKNITIKGITLDENNNSNTVVKLGHAEQVLLDGVTIQNVKNAHMIETAGIKNLTINQCTFKNQILEKNAAVNTYEAVQLDVLFSKHLNSYRSEDLPIRNVKVTKCTFKNVVRGIGSHTAIYNKPINGVEISNSKFKNCKSCAIQLFNATNVEIYDNQIEGVPRGVVVQGQVYGKNDVFLSSSFSEEGNTVATGKESYEKPAKDMGIVIKNNHIELAGTDSYATYENSGIWLEGTDLKKASRFYDMVPAGNYYVSGVTIAGNTVEGHGNGIKLVNVRNAVVSKNKCKMLGELGKKNYYGIAIKEKCREIIIKNNIINSYLNGIYVKDSKSNDISKNTVKNSKKYGIGVERGQVKILSSNKIEKSGSHGINIADKSNVKKLTGNKCSKVNGMEFRVDSTSKAEK